MTFLSVREGEREPALHTDIYIAELPGKCERP